MAYVDLTADFRGRKVLPEILQREVALKSDKTEYTGVVYNISTSTMMGSYIDFPGHIKETDDGVNGANSDLADFTNMSAAVIRFDRAGEPGGITAEDLENAYGGVPDTQAVIINALGYVSSFDIPPRSVYLTLDAVEWLKKTPCKVLVSDIYESTALEGVFLDLGYVIGNNDRCKSAAVVKYLFGNCSYKFVYSKRSQFGIVCKSRGSDRCYRLFTVIAFHYYVSGSTSHAYQLIFCVVD